MIFQPICRLGIYECRWEDLCDVVLSVQDRRGAVSVSGVAVSLCVLFSV